jgi:nucleoid DNA-binding protein
MKETVTRRDFIKLLKEKYNLRTKDAKAATNGIFNMIIETLAKGGRIEIRDFGIFEVVQRKAKVGRNIKMKTSVAIPPRKVVRFRQGRLMDEMITRPSMQTQETE